MKSFFEFYEQIDEAKAMLGAPRTDPRYGIDIFYAGLRRGPDGYKIKYGQPSYAGGGRGVTDVITDAEPTKKELLSAYLRSIEGVAVKITTQDGTIYRTVLPIPQWQSIRKDLIEKKHGSYGRIAGQQMQQAARGVGDIT